MSIKNEEVMGLVKNKLKEMEAHLNVLEMEVIKHPDEFNQAIVANANGKIHKLYQDIVYFLGVNDDNPKYTSSNKS